MIEFNNDNIPVDMMNYNAIILLEKLGVYSPSEKQINLVERLIFYVPNFEEFIKKYKV